MINSIKHIIEKEENSISKTIHRFAYTAFVFSMISTVLYIVLKLYYPALIVFSIGILFQIIVYLNKLNLQMHARVFAIITTNLGVLFFSPYIGFDAGVYLYIFMAPQLVYLLFKRKQKRLIYLCMSFNFITCFLIFIINHYQLVQPIQLDISLTAFLYSVNLLFSLIFSFVLASIFAKNNETFIDMLVDSNQQLEEQQEALKNEIIEKNKLNLELKQSVKDKEVLLSEVHHRVKNNLALVSGLLELENLFVKDKTVAEVLKNSKNRIKSIAMLHEKLYENKHFDRINIGEYVTDLIRFIELSYMNKTKKISINSEIDPIFMDMEFALPFSLMINELITNSFKHAFVKQESGTITIRISQPLSNICFEYQDDGVGFDIEKALYNDSIGMSLMNAFVRQLDAQIISKDSKLKGCSLTLAFKNESNFG
jgi:two-component sensor histidine kinase